MRKKEIKSKLIITILLVITLILNIGAIVMASEIVVKNPGENQFLELRAVEIKEIEGNNKQLTMELWTNDIDFERICSKIFI